MSDTNLKLVGSVEQADHEAAYEYGIGIMPHEAGSAFARLHLGDELAQKIADLIIGMGQLYDPMRSPFPTFELNDLSAISSDWQAVGKDLWRGIELTESAYKISEDTKRSMAELEETMARLTKLIQDVTSQAAGQLDLFEGGSSLTNNMKKPDVGT